MELRVAPVRTESNCAGASSTAKWSGRDIPFGIIFALRMARGLAASHLPKTGVDSTLHRPTPNVVRAKNRAIPDGEHPVSRPENDSRPLDKLQRGSAIHMRAHRQAVLRKNPIG
jgi:hypothetical protein